MVSISAVGAFLKFTPNSLLCSRSCLLYTSTVDFLVFTKDAHEDGIEVRVQDHDVWLTQKAIARLFDVDPVSYTHLDVYKRQAARHVPSCSSLFPRSEMGFCLP